MQSLNEARKWEQLEWSDNEKPIDQIDTTTFCAQDEVEGMDNSRLTRGKEERCNSGREFHGFQLVVLINLTRKWGQG